MGLSAALLKGADERDWAPRGSPRKTLPPPCKGEGNGRVPSPLQGSSLDGLVTQGCAYGSTLGYRPPPLRGWNPVQRSHAGSQAVLPVVRSPSAESFHFHVVPRDNWAANRRWRGAKMPQSLHRWGAAARGVRDAGSIAPGISRRPQSGPKALLGLTL
jgi:hypothetical protein